MSETAFSRLALYNGLTEYLGVQLADALMTYLPELPGTELATKDGMERLEDQVASLREDMGQLRSELRTEMAEFRTELRTEMRQLSERMDDNIDRLTRRMDRHIQVTGAGFIAMTTAIIASGFLA